MDVKYLLTGRLKPLLTMFFGIALTSGLWGQQSFTLEEAMSYGVGQSLSMRKKQLDIADAKEQVKEIRAIGMPKLNGGIEYQHLIDIPVSLVPADAFALPSDLTTFLEDVSDATDVSFPMSNGGGGLQELQFGLKNSLTASLTGSVLLFDGSYLVGLRAARLYKELAVKEMDQTASTVRVNVAKAYLAVLIAKRNQEIIGKNILNLTSSLKETKALYENGFAEKLDVDRLVYSLNNLESEKKRVDRLYVVSQNLLKFQMGYPIEEEIVVTDNLDLLVVSAGESAVDFEEPVNPSDRPELKVLETAVQLNDLNIQQFKAGYLPSLSAFGSYQRIFQANNVKDGKWFPTTVVGATLNIPIYNGLDRATKIQRAEIEGERLNVDKEIFLQSVALEVGNARINYMNALENVENQRKSEELASSIYQTTQIKYREGVGSSIELTQAERELYAAQASYIASLYELLISKVDLEKALGKL